VLVLFCTKSHYIYFNVPQSRGVTSRPGSKRFLAGI
jgi:hypothetical protein